MRKSLQDRFWEKVKKTNTCWIWIAGKSKAGYGIFDIKDETLRAHRVSWVLSFGDIPKNLLILHRCDNPSCVRPSHLFIGTHQDNITDCVKKGRRVYGNAKLTRDEIIEIIRLRSEDKLFYKDIGKIFKIDKTHVGRIVRGISWKNLVQNYA